MKQTFKLYGFGLLAVLVIGLVAFLYLRSCTRDAEVAFVPDTRIESSKAVLDSIHAIGQWELQSVEISVEVDTMQKRWLGLVKDKLQRRYYGRASIGIDMQKASAEWYRRDNDTIWVNLPEVCLLDSNFIDESRTKTIFSDNNDFATDSKVRKAMLLKARDKMIKESVTPATINTCHQQVNTQLSRRLEAIGYKKVVVTFNH